MTRPFAVPAALIAVASLCLPHIGSVAAAQPAASGPPPETVWPLHVDSPDGAIEVYQPQPEKFAGDELTARAAVSLAAPDGREPIFGAIWMTARVWTDRDSRTVTIRDLDVRRVRFPDANQDQEKRFEDVLEREIPRMNVTFPLDELMTSLDVAEKEKEAAAQIQTTPPKIIVSKVPATLVLIDGDPRLQPTDEPRVMRVVNTPFVLLFDMDAKRFFLRAGDVWLTAPEVSAEWAPIRSDPPRGIATVGDKLAQPPDPDDATPPDNAAPAAAGGRPPRIIVSLEPAELIATDGEPAYTPLPGNDLLYVNNTQSDVFMDVGTQQVYVLLSGRWYRAPSLKGPWEFVAADQLPAAFARIPAESPKGHVLASIAGTAEAKDAKLDARIPQTAAVRRDSGQDLAVQYDGDPQFDPVEEGSEVNYAVNTDEAVVRVRGRYYCCHQAVWYESPAAVGPWIVCISVPQVIYTIPPRCPVYHVRYCYVYSYTSEVVYCGYLPGYTGCYIYGPTVVYGTGYYYRPWYRRVYYPRPCTYGFAARYDPWVGTWGQGSVYHWDSRWFVRGGERHDWWGPRGYVDYHHLPRPSYAAFREGGRDRTVGVRENVRVVNNTYVNRINIYNRTENVKRNVEVINGENHVAGALRTPQVATPRQAPRPSVNERPVAAAPVRRGGGDNNVYAAHDGQVYRRTSDGWEQRKGQAWSKVETVPDVRPQPQPQPAQREREREQKPVDRTPARTGADRAASENKPAATPPREDNAKRDAAAQREREATARRETAQQQAQAQASPQRSNAGLEADHSARERAAEREKSLERERQQQQQQAAQRQQQEAQQREQRQQQQEAQKQQERQQREAQQQQQQRQQQQQQQQSPNGRRP